MKLRGAGLKAFANDRSPSTHTKEGQDDQDDDDKTDDIDDTVHYLFLFKRRRDRFSQKRHNDASQRKQCSRGASSVHRAVISKRNGPSHALALRRGQAVGDGGAGTNVQSTFRADPLPTHLRIIFGFFDLFEEIKGGIIELYQLYISHLIKIQMVRNQASSAFHRKGFPNG
ncbi:hypothetical protein E4L95_12385 [Paracoccus liaowanqingii]|uniref:Uncharacterized protein n=1 Tax=Paracoccus liaowanqingii TaxID=2560053 RepID=A0A4Z1BZ60_9RHOB|nr:hypothetical protein [Paracoccus liaowanqingii]TGN58601.1 hypothetical protein E4L95_12385 [Paracoccus liaowanqingii]